MWIFLITALADLFIWWNLVNDLKERSKALQAIVYAVKGLLSIIFVILTVRIIIYRGDFADPANAFRYIVLGLLTVIIISVGVLYLAMNIISRLLGVLLRRKPRRVAAFSLIMAGTLTVLFADGYFRQRFDLRIIRQEIPYSNLDARLDGMKILLISDLHLSSYYMHYDKLTEAIGAINAEKPDLLVNTGDFITFGWHEFGVCDTILSKAVAGSGAFAVVGNHDDGTYYPDYDQRYGDECNANVSSKIASSGYTLLEDTTFITTYNGAPIALSGITTHGHHLNIRYGDFNKLSRHEGDSVFNLLLLHDPAGWDVAASDGWLPQLTLSGHTHGMQIGMPVPGGYISPASLFHKNWKGLYRNKSSYLFVTTGLGTMGMALRIFMPPEIVVITLRKVIE